MARRLYSALLNPGVRQAALRQAAFLFLSYLLTFALFSNSSLANEPLGARTTGISWPILPGESVERLAAQFFPNNNPMQQQFVTRTLELSRGQHPSLTSAQVFKQAAVVTIPDLKTLSIELNPDQPDMESPSSASPSLHLSYQLQNPSKAKLAPKTVESMVPPAMQAEYERLLKRDRDLQLTSQNQDAHIANLEKVLEEVKPKVQAILAGDPAEAAETDAGNVDSHPLITDKPEPSLSLLQQISPYANWLMAAGTTLVLFLLLAYSRKQREQKLASLTGLNTFMYDTLSKPETITYDYTSDKAEVVDLSIDQTVSMDENPPDIKTSADIESAGLVGASDDAVPKIDPVTQRALAQPQEDEAEAVISSASILMGAGHAKQALMLLETYLQLHPQQSVYPWLYLLDIHRNLNQKAEFHRLLNRLHDNFNVMLPQWDEKETHIVVPESLEEYPHVIKQLQRIWQKSDAKAYLNALLVDRREGERVGFSLQVLQEIAMLQKVVEIRDELSAR